MSQGYRLNGGVIGFTNSWESDKPGVWDVKAPYLNLNTPPVPAGEYLYTTTGSHTFTVPANVTSICVLVIGGGGGGMYWGGGTVASYRMNGGGGGGLTYKNNISVTPGANYSVAVGAGGVRGAYSSGSTAGGTSSFQGGGINLQATGGNPGRYSTTVYGGTGSGGDSNRTGGMSQGYSSTNYGPAGGGGAAGYTGNGGTGGNRYSGYGSSAGSGGGGGGGGWSTTYYYSFGGGGVGVYGQGTNGGAGGANSNSNGGSPHGGTPSGGTNGGTSRSLSTSSTYNFYQGGGQFGGGGGGSSSTYSGYAGNGQRGVVRVIYGSGRAFPNTNTDLASSAGNQTIV